MGDKKKERWYYSFLPNNMSGGSTSPLITPLFVTEALGGTVAQVGLVSAISSAASVPSNILWGNLSDTMKKRRLFVFIGFGGMALAMLLMAFSASVAGYLFANFMLGLLACAATPVGTVLILESFEKDEWAEHLGDFSKVSGIGWLAGLVLGTVWLATLGSGNDPITSMRALFVVAAALSIVSMLLAYFLVPEPDRNIERHTIDPREVRSPMMFETCTVHAIENDPYLEDERKEPKNKELPGNPSAILCRDISSVHGFSVLLCGVPYLPARSCGRFELRGLHNIHR